jgi:hypothetical protein
MPIRRSMLLANHASSVGNIPASRFRSSMTPASHSKCSRYVGPSTSARSLRVTGASVVHQTAQSPPLPFHSSSGSMWPALTKPPIFSQKAPIETASPSGMWVGRTPTTEREKNLQSDVVVQLVTPLTVERTELSDGLLARLEPELSVEADQGAGNDNELEHRPEPLGAGSNERSRPVDELHRSTLRPAATMGGLWVSLTRRTSASPPSEPDFPGSVRCRLLQSASAYVT